MAKRRIKFKLGEIKIAGVELEIEDEREAATAALGMVQNQIAGVVQPALSKALLGAGQAIDGSSPTTSQPPVSTTRKRRKLTPTAAANSSEKPVPIPLVHEADKFGNPQQAWSTPNKGIWLLWVVEQAVGRTQLTIAEIVHTFNQHYRQFGTITTSNLGRDMGTLRKKTPPLVGADTNRSPQVWYLLDAGKAHAEKLARNLDGQPEQK